MTRQQIEQTVNTFLVEEFEIDKDKISDGARLKETLGIDSLDLVDLVVVVQKDFGFKMKLEEMRQLVTLKDFYDYIERKIS